MHTIAIDCGASFIKCALFQDETLKTTKQINTPVETQNGDIYSKKKIDFLIKAIRNIFEELSDGLDELALVIDNEMHGFILANQDGNALTDYISWQQNLLSADDMWSYLNAVIGEGKSTEIIKETGMPLRGGLPSTSLLWMKQEGLLREQGKLYFYTLGDYIYRIVFGILPICHPTNAAASGLFNMKSGDWNWDYISTLIGEAEIVFPPVGKDIIDCNYKGKTVHIYPAIGDQQASLLGGGLIRTDILSFNIGTGGQVSRMVEDMVFSDCQIRPYFYKSYLKTIPHIPSGRALNVYFRFIKEICQKVNPNVSDEQIWEIMLEAERALSTEKDELICDLSFFENCITDHSVAGIDNISEHGFTLENLMSSIVGQMANNFIVVAKKVNSGLDQYNEIVFSGGVAKRWECLRNRIVEGLRKDSMAVSVASFDSLYGCLIYSGLNEEDR